MQCIAPACELGAEVGALFCGKHMRAAPGQRGGWISAEKRRRAMGGSVAKEAPMDVSNVATRLWVGSKPPFDRELPHFDVLVLCAREIQPDRMNYRGRILRVPLPDSALTSDELRLAVAGGQHVAKNLVAGRRVLVTCAAGLNRSALVASLGLGFAAPKMNAASIIDLVRERRSADALNNQYFCQYLHRFVGQRA